MSDIDWYEEIRNDMGWGYGHQFAADMKAEREAAAEHGAKAAFTLTEDQWEAWHEQAKDAIYREMNGKYGDFGAGLHEAVDAAMLSLGFRRAVEEPSP